MGGGVFGGGGGSVWCGGRVAKGQAVGGLKGCKGANSRGGSSTEFFLQFEFRFRNGLGRILALQSFRITHLINAEVLAKFCTTRETKIKWKKTL